MKVAAGMVQTPTRDEGCRRHGADSGEEVQTWRDLLGASSLVGKKKEIEAPSTGTPRPLYRQGSG